MNTAETFNDRLQLAKLREGFLQIFGPGGNGPIRTFFAPGRVNLIGEHTDYTGGFVLPAALTNGTWAAVRKRNDKAVNLASKGFSPQVTCLLENEIVNSAEDGWGNYPKGIIKAFLENGLTVPGLDIFFYGDIPNGAGLSSSASLELVTAFALNALTQAGLDMLMLIKLAQQVENRFIGVNCGIMDQFAVGMGKKGQALLLNCATLDYSHIPLDLGEYSLIITNSNKQRGLGESKYNERRRECEEGFRIIKQLKPELANLGELSLEEWYKVKEHLSLQLAQRIEHVVRENNRVLASASALENGDLHELGQLMQESHESLQNLYEVTGPELDALYEAARRVPGCIGTRMTGAGFGGCTVSLVKCDKVSEFQKSVTKYYREQTGRIPDFYLVSIGDGVREVNPI